MRLDSANHVRAFTRLDVAALLGALTVLLVSVLPVIATDRSRSSRIHCANNLRQLWMALQLWGGEHGDQLLWNASMTDGGTRLHPLSANAWLHYAYLSNELASPKILLCPSDTGTPARDFSGHPESGYLHSNFRNRATSYFLNAHPNGVVLGTPFFYGNDVLLGDRNIPVDGSTGCSVFAQASYISVRPIRPSFGWKEGLHGVNAGHLLLYDGQVQFSDNAQLRAAFEFGTFDDVSVSGNRSEDVCLPR
jgi:hypothetical protein